LSSTDDGNVGLLVGLQYGAVGNAADQHAQELGAMRAKLETATRDALFHEAFARAIADLMSEILRELAEGADPAQQSARRLSDPSNVDGRNERFVRLASVHVRSLSEGRMRLSPENQLRIKAKRPIQ